MHTMKTFLRKLGLVKLLRKINRGLLLRKHGAAKLFSKNDSSQALDEKLP